MEFGGVSDSPELLLNLPLRCVQDLQLNLWHQLTLVALFPLGLPG